MAQILVRNLNESTKTYVQRRAQRNGRSMEAEVREILVAEEHKDRKPQYGLGTEIANMFRGVGLKKGEEIQELRGMRMRIPKF